MNPPFSNGDKHLLKALKMQEKGGGIICLLNAETLRNPYTETRKELVKQLNKYNAQIEYIENAFVSAERRTGVEEEIIAMFDRLTEEHSYYSECSKNRHLYDGWKTNKAHKIGKKVIIPCYGVFDSWDGKPRTYEARKVLEDIERILNFLDGGMTADIDLWNNLEFSFKRGETKNIELKYFTATFYKKGTVHLVFDCPELIERFNIYAAQNKAWLPPNYGKVKYKNMTVEEKAVVDSFQGEEDYNKVMAKVEYYFAPVTNNQMLMLGEG